MATRPDATIARTTEDLFQSLADGSIDFGVTSIDDWPLHLPYGIALAAVCERQDPLDVLLTHPPVTQATLPAGARVCVNGSARAAQLRRYRPDLIVVSPNQAILEHPAEAVIFPARALGRIDPREWNVGRLEPEILLPPPLQGIFVVAMRESERATLQSMRAALHEPGVGAAAAAEAGFRSALAAGPSATLAALATWSDESRGGGWMDLAVRILTPDGTQMLEGVTSERVESEQHGRDLGAALALDLVGQGALDLLDLSAEAES